MSSGNRSVVLERVKQPEDWYVLKSQVVEEWREEVRVEERRESLTRILRKRFGSKLPTEPLARIQSEQDTDILRQWFDFALDVSSIDEFRRLIDCP